MELTPQNVKPSERASRSMVMAIMLGLLFIGWVGEWPVKFDTDMYLGQWRSIFVVFGPLFVPVSGIRLFPWQLLLIGLAPFCFPGSSAARRHAPEMDRAILVSIACIAVTFLWGCLNSGSPYFAYYQLWRFLTALSIAFMLMSLVRTENDIIALGNTLVLATLIRATLCIYYFWTHLYGKVYPLPEYVTNHDDSILFVVATVIVLAWASLKGGRGPWIVAALVVPYVFYAMVLNNRRIAWVELGLSLPVTYVLIGAGALRSRINKWAIRVAPVLLIYVVAGMGSDSQFFFPVHALLTTGSNYDPSSLTRQEEARNLLHTLVDIGNPLLGIGWGRPYDKAESVWSNYPGWLLTLYTPHNSILGLAAYAGLLGIVGIWGVVPVAAYLAARGYRHSTGPVPRVAGISALGAIAAYSAHCYGDIGLQSFPGALVFGAALAVAGKISVWRQAQPAVQTLTVRAGDTSPAYKVRPRPQVSVARWRRYDPPKQPPESSDEKNRPAKPIQTPKRLSR